MKIQTQRYVAIIENMERAREAHRTREAKLVGELAALKGKGSHIRSCDVPSTLFRRIGSLWQCHCGQTWRLGYLRGFMVTEFKVWKQVEG